MAERRVIFCNRYFYPDHSATSQMLSDLAFDLARSDWDVWVITSRLRYDDALAELPARETIHGVKVHRIWTTRHGRARLIGRVCDYLTFYFAATATLWKLVKRGDVLVPKTDPPLIAVPLALLAHLHGAKLVNWLQDLFPEVAIELGIRGFGGMLGTLLARLRNRSLRQASVNVVIGERMRNRLLRFGIPESRVVVVPNWADGDHITAVPKASNLLRVEWQLTDKFVVGYSGNLGRAHEFATLLDAAKRLSAHLDLVFLLIGGGSGMEALKVEADSHGLSNIIFKPYQPHKILAQSLSAADVHLITLRPKLEGLIVPSKFYGIAAAARPIIFVGDEFGELAVIVKDTEAGLVVREGDGAMLSQAIVELKENPRVAERMGACARKVFDTRFCRPAATARWRSVLMPLVEEGLHSRVERSECC